MSVKSPALTGRFSSPRFQRRLLLASAAVFAAGLIAFVATYFHGTSNAFNAPISNQPAQLYHPDKAVPFDSKVLIPMAREFMRTAVLRHNVDAAWPLVGVDLRGRMTRKDWDTGNIPVIGYPARNIDTASFVVDYSYQRSALVEVDLVAQPHSGPFVRPHLLFYIGFKREGDKPNGRWQINYWEPHWRPPVPLSGAG